MPREATHGFLGEDVRATRHIYVWLGKMEMYTFCRNEKLISHDDVDFRL